MPLKVSNTFFMSGTGGAANPSGAHLMVCLAITGGGAVIVPIVSRHDHSDTACVLNVGDHPFIRHESCAAYDFIKSIPVAAIEADAKSGLLRPQASVSAEVLVRLQVGLVTSDETAPWAFEAARGALLTKWLKHRGHM